MAESIVIYRLGSLGDTVVALPCFNAIAHSFPNARRIALTNVPVSGKAAPLESILRPCGLIHDVVEYPVGTRSPDVLFALRKTIRKKRATSLIYLNSAPLTASRVLRDIAFFRLCGFRQFFAVPLSSKVRSYRVDAEGGCEYECRRLARTLGRFFPVDVDAPEAWNLWLAAWEKDAARRVLSGMEDPFVAINLGGKPMQGAEARYSKDWGQNNWRELLSHLCKGREPIGLVTVGSADERERSDDLLTYWTGQKINACGRMSPRETAALLSHASMFIGHDSGPMHLAAAVGTRCIGLFGGYSLPKVWHPYGPHTRAIHTTGQVSSITVAQVRAAIESLSCGECLA